jgi:hypothetical protein
MIFAGALKEAPEGGVKISTLGASLPRTAFPRNPPKKMIAVRKRPDRQERIPLEHEFFIDLTLPKIMKQEGEAAALPEPGRAAKEVGKRQEAK